MGVTIGLLKKSNRLRLNPLQLGRNSDARRENEQPIRVRGLNPLQLGRNSDAVKWAQDADFRVSQSPTIGAKFRRLSSGKIITPN